VKMKQQRSMRNRCPTASTCDRTCETGFVKLDREGKGQVTEAVVYRTVQAVWFGGMRVKAGWEMSLTEAGVGNCDESMVVVVKADVRPEVGTGLKVSGIVAVKLTTTVEAAWKGDIVLPVTSVVLLWVLDDSVTVFVTEEAASDSEAYVCDVSAADILLFGAADSEVEVGELAGTSENLLQETTAEMDEMRVVGSVVFSRQVLAKVGFWEEIVIDGSIGEVPS